MTWATWHLAAVALALGAGGCAFALLGKRNPEERQLAALLPLLIYLIAATAAVAIAAAGVDVNWTNARLLPSVAFAKGLGVYSTLRTGSIQTTAYPPGWVLAYLPTALGSSPTAVLVIGHCLSHAFALLPALAFFWVVSRNAGVTLLTTALFEFFLYWTEPLQTIYVPHADAPALGFGLTALLLFWVSQRKAPGAARGWTLFLATGVAWLSLWTKQVMAPVLPAMALLVLYAEGFRPLLRFCGFAAASGLAVALCLLALFPAEGVWFNTILLLQRCPWVGELPWNLLGALDELVREGLLLLLLLTVGASALRALRGSATERPERRVPDAWAIAGLAALVLVPMSVLGRVKVGGWPNTLSPTLYCLLAALCLMLPCAYRHARAAPDAQRLLVPLRRLMVLLALVVSVAWSLALSSDLESRHFGIRNNAAQQAFDYLEHKDPNAYFPLHPLSHLMAQGVLYNYSSAVHDREVLGRYPLSRRQRRRFFPSQPSLVCWRERAWGNEYVQSRYFAAYSLPVAVPELPAFRCLAPAAGQAKP